MKRKIPVKNYFILAIVVLLTVVLAFYMRDWYNTSKEYYAQNSVMTKVVREIKSEEITNFTLENQKFILYVSSGQNVELKNFENDLKDLIKISKTCANGAEFKEKVAAKYPNYSGQNYLDMTTSYFFK